MAASSSARRLETAPSAAGVRPSSASCARPPARWRRAPCRPKGTATTKLSPPKWGPPRSPTLVRAEGQAGSGQPPAGPGHWLPSCGEPAGWDAACRCRCMLRRTTPSAHTRRWRAWCAAHAASLMLPHSCCLTRAPRAPLQALAACAGSSRGRAQMWTRWAWSSCGLSSTSSAWGKPALQASATAGPASRRPADRPAVWATLSIPLPPTRPPAPQDQRADVPFPG